MKKTLTLLAGAILSLGLTACGGGTASPPSIITIPVPTTGPVSYKLTIRQLDGDVQRQTSSVKRTVRADSTPAPVIITEPDAPLGAPMYQYATGQADTTATAIAEVNPQPSASPSAPIWTTPTSEPITLKPVFNPSPGPTPDPRIVIAAQQQNNTFTSSVTSSVNVPSSGLVTGTTSVYQYHRFILGCASQAYLDALGGASVEYAGGVKFINGNPMVATNLSDADVAMVGPTCAGSYNDSTQASNQIAFLHGGDVVTGQDFLTLTPSSWTGHTTYAPVRSLIGLPLVDLVFHTADAKTVYVFISFVQPGDDHTVATLTGPTCEQTFCVDGR